MSTAFPKQIFSEIVPQTVQTLSSVYRQDQRVRFAMETAAIGLVLLVGVSVFSGSHTVNAANTSHSSGTYQPAPSTHGAPPSLTPQQVQAIAAQSGAPVVTPPSVEPIKVKPVFTEENAAVSRPITPSNDPFTYQGRKTGPRPMFVEDKKE